MENKTKRLTGRLPGLMGKALLTAVLAPALSLTGVLSVLPVVGETLMSLAPVMTVYAQNVVRDNLVNETLPMLSVDESMDNNHGTIGRIDGNNTDKGQLKTNHPGAMIVFNNGDVEENAGTINQTGQFGTVDQNAATGEITENWGTVTTNAGTVVENIFGTIKNNKGTVKENYGKVIENTDTGTVNNVNSNATVDTNKGIVNLTDGTVKTNDKSGIVIVNANGTGMVDTNDGTVHVSEGAQITIDQNNGTVNNFGGVVDCRAGNNVVHYFSVELSAPANTSAGFTGFTQNQNKNWLTNNQKGTITLTPAAGYQINSVTSSAPGTTVVKNADGTWTVTVNNITGNIKASDFTIAVEMEQAAPAPAPGNRNTPGSAQPVNPVFHLNLSDLFGDGSAQTASQPAPSNVAETKQNFDSVYYADNNPDLYEAYGYDHDLLWDHYVTVGRQEGRKVRFVEGIHKGAVDEGKGKEDFDAIAYADYYADLFAVYGYDEDALWNHYDTVGRAEGRLYFFRQVS